MHTCWNFCKMNTVCVGRHWLGSGNTWKTAPIASRLTQQHQSIFLYSVVYHRARSLGQLCLLCTPRQCSAYSKDLEYITTDMRMTFNYMYPTIIDINRTPVSKTRPLSSFQLIHCKIHASLFLSSSGPHAMVQEAFVTTKDILIVRRFCARQVEIYNCISTHSTNEYIVQQTCSQRIVLQVRNDFNLVHQTATYIVAI